MGIKRKMAITTRRGPKSSVDPNWFEKTVAQGDMRPR